MIRPAVPEDAATIAAIARLARATAMPWLPVLHSVEGDTKFYANRVLPNQAVEVAEVSGQITGFCAVNGDEVDHLYIHPTHQGQGIGSILLNRAKARAPFLQLWVFERNTIARAFYAGHGFTEVTRTDGSGNEERCPDLLLEWRSA